MNENMNIGSAEDIFDGITLDDLVDEGAETDENTETEEPEADQQTETGEGEDENGIDGGEEKKDEGADQTFTLKYLGADKTVNRDEIITLAQKGMDYDRIHGKYTEGLNALKEANDKLAANSESVGIADSVRELAKANGMSVDDFIQRSFAAIAAAENGTDIDTELPRIKLDFERKAFEKQKADWEKNKDNGASTDAGDEAVNAELAEFERLFPDAAKDTDTIPKEVWDAKRTDPNKSLAEHYRDYLSADKDRQIADLKAQLEQAQQSAKNRQRSTGSLDGGGNNAPPDMWDAAWADAIR